MDKNNKPSEQQQISAEQQFPGAAIDYADNERENAEMVKADVKELNDNPRNNKLDE